MRMPVRLWGWVKLSPEAEEVLCRLAAGGALKAHRSVDGEKVVRLHPLSGPPIDVSVSAMDQLKQHRLLESNMKFPAATYLLTPEGKRLTSEIVDSNVRSTGPHHF